MPGHSRADFPRFVIIQSFDAASAEFMQPLDHLRFGAKLLDILFGGNLCAIT